VESPLDIIESALKEVDSARKRLIRGNTKQITQSDELDYLKSLAYAWFKSHRPGLQDKVAATELSAVDTHFERVLGATGRASARTTYIAALKDAKESLTQLRSGLLTAPASAGADSATPPDFSALASDPAMRAILVRRWEECQLCLNAGAHLAATVMMGGFLEALFVARANQLPDKGPLFRAKTTPVDQKLKKPLSLSEWTLRHYIDVGQELGWISRSGREVAAVLRDYRNYIHPEKERSHGVALNGLDSSMFWEVTKSLAQQLLHHGQPIGGVDR
jgi:hypothetical protein